MDELMFHESFKNGRFVQIPEAVIKSPALTMQARLLYAVIVSYAWKGTAFPGLERLGKDCNIHANTVSTYLKELQAIGLISITRRGLGKTNLYELQPVLDELLEKLAADSQYTVNPDSQCTVNQDSLHVVLKTYTDIKHTKKETDTKDMRQGAAGRKKKSHIEVSREHIEQARLGQFPWEKVSDRDFTLYYIEQHNSRMEKPITFDRYSSVSIFRENFIKAFNIQRHQVCEYIDELLRLYMTHPNKWQSLTFNMIQKNTRLMNELVRHIEQKLKPAERRFAYNNFKSSNDSGNNSGPSF